MRPWHFLLSILLVLGAGLGLLVLAGGARGLLVPALSAELVVQDFPVPPGLAVDPDHVAAFMARQLQDRLSGDVAIRLTLKDDAVKKVKDIVLPRLMNVVVVQAMLHDIPELSAILDLGQFQRSVTGRITARQAARDVALTMPAALLAVVDGQKVKVTTTETGLTALDLGDMAAGESHDVTLWLGAPTPPAPGIAPVALARQVRLGAAEGLRGRVLIWGDRGWFGADMEALRWSRWLVGGLLAGVLLFGLASLILPILTRRKG